MSGLSDICAAIVARLSAIPNIDQVTAQPPAQLPDNRMIVVVPRPGPGSPWTHASDSGHPVVLYEDKIGVEAHYKLALDQEGPGISWATPMLDAVRDALWKGYLTDRFDATVTELRSIATDGFGPSMWGADNTFGFGLTLDLTHAEEVM